MRKRVRTAAAAILALCCFMATEVPALDIPIVHQGIAEENGQLVYIAPDGSRLISVTAQDRFTLAQFRKNPIGTENGVAFDFDAPELNGRIHYGFLNGPEMTKHSYPVFFNRSAKITEGRADIDIKNQMAGRYDFIDWQGTGLIRLGYRVITDRGDMLYDGKILLTGTGPFVVDTSIVEGPFINMVSQSGAVVSLETNYADAVEVVVGGRTFATGAPDTHHEIVLSGLEPATEYSYTVRYGAHEDAYSFRTAPPKGSRQPFTFAYASDGRGNNGGGERDIKGANAYIMKRIGVVCAYRDVRFLQFTGDLIWGYTTNEGEIELELVNWKRAVEPFAHYIPFIAGKGNHELLMYEFQGDGRKVRIDRFPFDAHSSEAVFDRHFVNPTHGPVSEDGSAYDPDPDKQDFPSYGESVFHYTYGNVAVVCLNTSYWFSRSLKYYPEIGGNLKGYIMDNQLSWLETTLAMYEDDPDIDQVFVTTHCPVFPNGGHTGDDMWYSGNNEKRPWIAGQPVAKGIIERRDEFLDILMNKSSKVVAVFTGDEHNYNTMRLTAETPIYPDGYPHQRLTEFRPLWLINNGAAGAPYYGQEETPWTAHVRSFSTQNALVLLHVNGEETSVEVINPDTMELLDEFEL